MPPKVHVHKGDTVMVTVGKDAGKKGKVLAVNPEKQRVIIEGVNVVKRHTRPSAKAPQGGIISKEATIDSSNVMIVCGSCNQPTRVGKRFLDDKSKTRYCKKCGEVIDK